MKKTFIIPALLMLAIGSTFATSDLEKSVNSDIISTYNDLNTKFKNKEIDKTKFVNEFKNKIYILKEIYGNKLSDEFYDSKIKLVEQIDQASSGTGTIMKSDKTETKQSKSYTGLNQKEINTITVTMNTLFKKLKEKTSKDQLDKLNGILDTLTKKQELLKKSKETKNTIKLSSIIKLINDTINIRIAELSGNQ